MTRHYPKRKDFIASHQRLVERRRKDDIATLSSGGGGAGGFCSIGFSGDTNVFASRRCWPFNRTAQNTGGFTIDPGFSYIAGSGTAIRVPADGVYQFGLSGYLDFDSVNPSGTMTQVTSSITTDVVAYGDTGVDYCVASQMSLRLWLFLGGVWQMLLGFEEYLNIISSPLFLSADTPIFVSSNTDAYLTGITANGGQGISWTVELWVRAL